MKFSQYLLGPTDPALFSACVFFAAIGVVLMLLIGTTMRNKDSEQSPLGFSWKYLRSDNAKRIYANVIVVLLALRFTPELFGFDLSVWKALCIGMSSDGIMLIIKQKTSILDPKKES